MEIEGKKYFKYSSHWKSFICYIFYSK